MTVPAAPAAPGPPAPGGKRPSAAGWVIGAILISVAVIVGIVGFAIGGLRLVEASNEFDDLRPGHNTVTLSSGTYAVWERVGAFTSLSQVSITSPSGTEVAVRPGGSIGSTYPYGDDEYREIGTFRAPEPGGYDVEVRSSGVARVGGSELAIGPTYDQIFSDALPWLLGAIGIAAVLSIAGVIVLIITGVRRSRWTRQQRPAYAVGPPGPGFGSTGPGFGPTGPGFVPPPGVAPPGPSAPGPSAPAPPAPGAESSGDERRAGPFGPPPR
jgi:hypothetical protein